MRYKTYKTHWSYMGPGVKKRELLVDFVLDISYLFGTDGVIPPLHVLNEVLTYGGNNGGMGPGTTWRPFKIAEAEYAELVEALLHLDIEAARKKHPYIFFEQLVIDPELSSATNYADWIEKRAAKLKAEATAKSSQNEVLGQDIQYLTTHLKLVSNRNPLVLIQTLENHGLIPLFVEQETGQFWKLAFDINISQQAEHDIAQMLNMLEVLEGEAGQLWLDCGVREFDIGYTCGETPFPFNDLLSVELLRRIVHADARLRITIYPDK